MVVVGVGEGVWVGSCRVLVGVDIVVEVMYIVGFRRLDCESSNFFKKM